MNTLPKIIAVVGPTASGKTALGLMLAKKFNGEIVNADSRQVYRGMDIATAKPDKNELASIRHHLIDIAEPDDEFTLANFKEEALEAIDDILARNKLPIIVGGTGLYVKAIIDNLDIPAVAPDRNLRSELGNKKLGELAVMLAELDPACAEKIDMKNPRRVMRALEIALSNGKLSLAGEKKLPARYDVLQIGLKINREELYQRISARINAQLESGLLAEVQFLSKKYAWDLPSMSGIGYKQLGYFLRNEISLPEAVELIKRDTRRYAKRQLTWYKKDPRVNWIADEKQAEKLVSEFVS